MNVSYGSDMMHHASRSLLNSYGKNSYDDDDSNCNAPSLAPLSSSPSCLSSSSSSRHETPDDASNNKKRKSPGAPTTTTTTTISTGIGFDHQTNAAAATASLEEFQQTTKKRKFELNVEYEDIILPDYTEAMASINNLDRRSNPITIGNVSIFCLALSSSSSKRDDGWCNEKEIEVQFDQYLKNFLGKTVKRKLRASKRYKKGHQTALKDKLIETGHTVGQDGAILVDDDTNESSSKPEGPMYFRLTSKGQTILKTLDIIGDVADYSTLLCIGIHSRTSKGCGDVWICYQQLVEGSYFRALYTKYFGLDGKKKPKASKDAYSYAYKENLIEVGRMNCLNGTTKVVTNEEKSLELLEQRHDDAKLIHLRLTPKGQEHVSLALATLASATRRSGPAKCAQDLSNIVVSGSTHDDLPPNNSTIPPLLSCPRTVTMFCTIMNSWSDDISNVQNDDGCWTMLELISDDFRRRDCLNETIDTAIRNKLIRVGRPVGHNSSVYLCLTPEGHRQVESNNVNHDMEGSCRVERSTPTTVNTGFIKNGSDNGGTPQTNATTTTTDSAKKRKPSEKLEDEAPYSASKTSSSSPPPPLPSEVNQLPSSKPLILFCIAIRSCSGREGWSRNSKIAKLFTRLCTKKHLSPKIRRRYIKNQPPDVFFEKCQTDSLNFNLIEAGSERDVTNGTTAKPGAPLYLRLTEEGNQVIDDFPEHTEILKKYSSAPPFDFGTFNKITKYNSSRLVLLNYATVFCLALRLHRGEDDDGWCHPNDFKRHFYNIIHALGWAGARLGKSAKARFRKYFQENKKLIAKFRHASTVSTERMLVETGTPVVPSGDLKVLTTESPEPEDEIMHFRLTPEGRILADDYMKDIKEIGIGEYALLVPVASSSTAVPESDFKGTHLFFENLPPTIQIHDLVQFLEVEYGCHDDVLRATLQQDIAYVQLGNPCHAEHLVCLSDALQLRWKDFDLTVGYSNCPLEHYSSTGADAYIRAAAAAAAADDDTGNIQTLCEGRKNSDDSSWNNGSAPVLDDTMTAISPKNNSDFATNPPNYTRDWSSGHLPGTTDSYAGQLKNPVAADGSDGEIDGVMKRDPRRDDVDRQEDLSPPPGHRSTQTVSVTTTKKSADQRLKLERAVENVGMKRDPDVTRDSHDAPDVSQTNHKSTSTSTAVGTMITDSCTPEQIKMERIAECTGRKKNPMKQDPVAAAGRNNRDDCRDSFPLGHVPNLETPRRTGLTDVSRGQYSMKLVHDDDENDDDDDISNFDC